MTNQILKSVLVVSWIYFALPVFAAGVIPPDELRVIDLSGSDAQSKAQKVLQGIPDSIRNAQVVGIGESGHGVAGFHTERGFLAQVLIGQLGFRKVLIEEGVFKVRPLRDLISICGKRLVPRSEMALMARKQLDGKTYGHVEFLEFLNWMCDWNQKFPNDLVELHGIDLWDMVWELRDAIVLEVKRFGLEEKAALFLATAKENCFYWKVSSTSEALASSDYRYYQEHFRLDPSRTAKCYAALKQIEFLFEDHRSRIESQWGASAYRDGVAVIDSAVNREVVRDFQQPDFFRAMSLRGALQSRQVLRLIDQQKAVFLAHNVHVGKAMSRMRSDVVTPSDDYPSGQFVSSGEILWGTLGPGYASIGVGGYDLSSIRDGQYPIPTSTRSIDFQLEKQCKETCFVETAPLTSYWWMHNETARRGMWGIPAEQFDAYYFIRKAIAATPIPEVLK